MKKYILSLVSIALLSFTLFAQSNEPASADIIWGNTSKCSDSNTTEVKAATPVCQRIETENGTFYITTYKGVTVAMTYAFPSRYIRTTIQLTNASGNEITFDPKGSTVDVFQSRTAYIKGKNQIELAKNITAEDAKALYIEAQKNSRVLDFGGPLEFPSHSAQSQSATVTYTTSNGRISGVSTGVPNSPVKQDQTRINVEGSTLPKVPSGKPQPQMATKDNQIDRAKLALYDGGLKAGSIPAQQKAAGYVFFEQIKDRTLYSVFRIAVGKLVFVFPEETDSDKKNLAKKK